jgi:hypothetical protein
MKPCELQPILARAVKSVGQPVSNHYWSVPPEARVVTGNPVYDAQLHYVLVEFGVEVELDKSHAMKDYRVVDEQKFTMFLLRWQ